MKTSLVFAAALFAALTISHARAQEPGSATVVPIAVNGDPAARFSLVVMSDGYTAADMPRYRRHLDTHLNVLWSIEPFRSYRNYINVYSVEIVSADSGITCDPEVREKRNTPLSAVFGGGCTNPNARGITVNQNAAREYAKKATPHFDQILVITNTDTYGGIGGAVATTSGGNSLGVLITPHELGHSLGRLQDEYTYSARGKPGGEYDGQEPNSVHHTLMTEEQMKAEQKKWWRWLGEDSESGGKIGRFEGGQQRTKGIWRPSKHSMMISIGYYFDQVSRERMVQRISEQVQLIADSTPTDTPVPGGGIIWVEAAHPNYHNLEITWRLDGVEVRSARNRPVLSLTPNAQRAEVTVVDPTPFVRDPGVREKALTATRTWTIAPSPKRTLAELSLGSAPTMGIRTSTPTSRPVGATDVVFVVPSSYGPEVEWSINGIVLKSPGNPWTVDLGDQKLRPGIQKLSVILRSRARSAGPPSPEVTREWTIDNTMPTVKYTLSPSVSTTKDKDGLPHYTFTEEFTMKLDPSDDQTGYVVAEFRVNGDGWHHYYGWPDAPEGTPYKFTPRGTTIKELVYGSLSSEGLSPQPWEERKPGYGTHKIEVRAIDAAGNIGPVTVFKVTVTPK